MMLTDILVCVLTLVEVYGVLKGQKLVENKPKLADVPPKFRKRNFGASHIVLRHPQ